MRLKRLTLHGFKTFADKTVIEFVPGVTCIVGPNGSGTSNLLDALVWCLGEQKASTVRATRNQDVIFAGSAKRKPMGMAEVSLTVDNEDRFLPLDFNEVTVTRRVYRDGESEYFINKTACRLKDIAELFFDTGVGRGAYAIVSQSEIDAILSAKPETRRELFEEAAGIKKYRVRKREAERKLENTEANLIRVRDILSEISGQVDPLRIQAETAEKYIGLSDRLREIEVGVLAADYTRLTGEHSTLLQQARQAAIESEQIGIEIISKEDEVLAARQDLSAAEKHRDDARQQVSELRTDVQNIQSRIDVAAERRKASEATIASLETDIEATESSREQILAERRTKDDSVNAKTVQLNTATQDLQRADQSARETEQQLAAIVRALAGQEADYIALARKLASQKSELKALEERIALRKSSSQSLQGKVGDLRAEVDASDAAILAAEAHVTTLKDTEVTLRAQLETARTSTLADIVTRREEAFRTGNELQRSIAGLESRLMVLEETEAALEGYFAGVKAVMRGQEDGDIEGRFDVFADVIRVPQDYETAIEVALGASLQDIVTDTERNAKAAIRWLNETRSGRATFLPLDQIRDVPVPDSLRLASRQHTGVLGSAADLIEFDADVEVAVRMHLSRVLVVDDLDVATSVSRKIGRDWARIVTLGGEVVVPTGAITGGRAGKQGPNLLARKREIAELGERLEGSLKRLDAARATVERLAEEEGTLRGQLAKVEAQLNETVANVRGAQAGVSAAKLAAEKVAREAKAHEQQLQTIVNQITVDEGNAAKLSAAISEADLSDEGAQATREDFGKRQASLSLKRDEQREASRQLASDVATLRAEVEALKRERHRLDELLARNQTDTEFRAKRIADARRVLSEDDRVAGERLETLNAAKIRLGAAIEIADAADKKRDALRTLTESQHKVMQELHLAMQKATGAEQAAKIKIARLETQIDTVVQRLQDEYELHPDAAVALTGGDAPPKDIAQEIARLRREIKALGTVNVGAIEEYAKVSERFTFLTEQQADLVNAKQTLLGAISDIDQSTVGVLEQTYKQVGEAFRRYFARLFGGGSTDLVLTDPDNVLDSGVEIHAQPPGKRRQNLALLSGGERALTATALLFAFLEVRPAPFCVLDEVDAPLDGLNVEKFADLVKDFGTKSQFVLITHNATTMEAAPLWFGVTMQEPGVSRGLSLKVPEQQQELIRP